MNESFDELTELLSALRTQPPGASGEHLAPPQLRAYHRGECSPDEEARAQDHLVTCAACSRALLDLARPVSSSDTGAPQISDAEISTQWKQLQTRLGLSQQPEAATSANLFQLPPRFAPASSTYALYAVAASLLIAAVALAVWVVALRRDNERLVAQAQTQSRRAAELQAQLAARTTDATAADQSVAELRRELDQQREANARRAASPETEIAALHRLPTSRTTVPRAVESAINVASVELYPNETLRGGPSENIKTIELTKDAPLFTLTLNANPRVANETYALDISNQNNRTVWSSRGLRQSANGTFTVALPRRLFPAGEYRLQLYGLRDGRKELAAGYTMRVKQ